MFGDIACKLSYAVLYTSYFFIAFAIVCAFVISLLSKKFHKLLVLIAIFIIWVTSILIYVFGENLPTFVNVQWRNESLCTVKLNALLSIIKKLKIVELFVPSAVLVFYIFCRLFDSFFGKKFLKASKLNKIFLIMILVYIISWTLQLGLEKYEILFLNVVQCLSLTYRPILYAVMHDDVKDFFKNVFKRKKLEEDSYQVDFSITHVDENI